MSKIDFFKEMGFIKLPDGDYLKVFDKKINVFASLSEDGELITVESFYGDFHAVTSCKTDELNDKAIYTMIDATLGETDYFIHQKRMLQYDTIDFPCDEKTEEFLDELCKKGYKEVYVSCRQAALIEDLGPIEATAIKNNRTHQPFLLGKYKCSIDVFVDKNIGFTENYCYARQ